MEKNSLYVIGTFVISLAVFFIFNDYLITFAALIIITGGLVWGKKLDKRAGGLCFVLFFIFSVGYAYFFSPSVFIAKNQGTVLSDNWFQALKWVNENTPECAVVATYWDPGHFITGIGRRAVVFDGASQSRIRTVKLDGADTTTATIQDIATTLYTDNETLAMNILKKYRKDCNEMYYIASNDLIGKSVWWSYFSTWDPVNKGRQLSYAFINLAQSRPVVGQPNVVAYIYSFGNQQVVVKDDNGVLSAYLQQGAQLAEIEKLMFATPGGALAQKVVENAPVKGTIYLEPSRQTVIYMPSELENSLFTRMYFFHGAGMQHFEFVNNWGGEVKLFKVKFDDTPQNATFLGQKLECCIEEKVVIHDKLTTIRNATIVDS